MAFTFLALNLLFNLSIFKNVIFKFKNWFSMACVCTKNYLHIVLNNYNSQKYYRINYETNYYGCLIFQDTYHMQGLP